ncbi:TonB-dependent receptor [Rhodocytophaga aerolata]|uniref:TonB-dependent receptor n=1 Tax=Rhodocytophaga aerolata TaxID=455078 RepID=A0ABT8RCA7_9BACT|nr:outer membrane beta-barrel protein [Rhodocytophaga aerolata]MDO1449735.1 TonB-dependent receptor [Rhodocytophaga aerolata]
MKTFCALLILLSVAYSSFGQITGKVANRQQEPVPFANVVLYHTQDSSIVSGTATDEKGMFSIPEVSAGRFYLKVSSIGYTSLQSASFEITALNQHLEIFQLILSEENTALNEVVIAAKKEMLQHTSLGKVINVQSSLITKGSNALQVLERLPGVITDRRNNQLSLNGQSGVTVMLNGRRLQLSMEELMGLLENTVADNIEKIELITSPTAGYDADGGAGIINIVLKKSEGEGTTVNVSATAGYGYREKALGSLSLSQGFDKATLFASYSFLHEVGRSGYMGGGTSNRGFLPSPSRAIFSGISRKFVRAHTITLAAEYRLTSKTTLGGDIMYARNNTHNLADNAVTWEFTNGDYLGFSALSDGFQKRNNLVSSLYVKNKLSEQSQLNFDLSYIRYTSDSPALISSNYFDRQGNPMIPQNPIFTAGNRGESLSNILAGVLAIDYSLELNNKVSAGFGVKGSLAENRNDSKIERKLEESWEIDPRSQSAVYSQEKIAAIYAQWKYVLHPKSTIQAGLRYEYWQREVNLYDKPFTMAKLFPTVTYTFTPSDKATLSINYNRRISRPAYTDLISNLFYNDPTFVFSGNPLLKPTLTDVLKADYTTRGLTLGLSLQHEVHPILRYQITTNQTKDIGISSPQNLDYQKSINLFVSYPLSVTKWWKIWASSTTSLRNYKVSYSLKPAEKTFVFQNLNLSQNIVLPKNFEVELSGWYNFPFFEGTNHIKGFGVLNAGIAKKLPRNRGTFQLSLPDVLRSFGVHTHISGMTPIVFNISTVAHWRDESAFYQVVKLTYSRSFGKSTAHTLKRSDNEEKDRIK